jgi:hypothetical protein
MLAAAMPCQQCRWRWVIAKAASSRHSTMEIPAIAAVACGAKVWAGWTKTASPHSVHRTRSARGRGNRRCRGRSQGSQTAMRVLHQQPHAAPAERVALNPESVHSAGVDDKDDEWMNTMDIQLVCSTDGRRYRRVGAREPILRVGAPRTSDAGYVYPPNAPFIKDGEVYLYYAYGNELHGNPPRHGMPIERGVGLAKIPRDRLVCIKQEHTAQEAVLTTVPLVAHPTTLRLNLDTSTDGASCAIELCDPFGRTLPGFSRADCDEMKGVDATEVCVRWRDSSGEKLQLGHGGGQELEAKMVSQSRGTVKLRVFLNGGARLYAIYT